MPSEVPKRNIIIVGGGIIGSTTAYFLTRHPSYNPALHSITLIEATSIASAASGKAGGLLALWAYPSCIVPLSYRLHAQLAQEHNGASRWGYRTLHCGSLAIKGRPQQAKQKHILPDKSHQADWKKLPKIPHEGTRKKGKVSNLPEDLDWFETDNVMAYESMGDPTTTAQVHPYQFTTSMAELAVERGVNIVYGSVTSISRSNDTIESLSYRSKETQETTKIDNVTDIIICAGPWTSQILPEAPITATRAHSVVLKAPVTPYAIFSEIDLPSGFDGRAKSRPKTVSPEMYARPDGTIYACGEGDTLVKLPASADLVECDAGKCQEIVDCCASISDVMRDAEVLVEQACYLPAVSSGGGPLIGKTKTKGLFLAAGHTCWGIQNSCATGLLMSEFIFDNKAKSANIDSLDPRRYL